MPSANQPFSLEPLQTPLVSILKIIGHPQSEAVAYASAISDRITEVALFTLSFKLVENKDTVQKAQSAPNFESMMNILLETIDAETIKNIFSGAAFDVLGTYFKQIMPSLKETQKAQIRTIIESIKL